MSETPSNIRKRILLRLRSGSVVTIDQEESAEVNKLMGEHGQLQAFRNRAEEVSANKDRIAAALRAEIRELGQMMAAERRMLWDGYAGAALAGGKEVDAAATIADQMLTERRKRFTA